MKTVFFALCLVFCTAPAGFERNYTASTPASSLVRHFLGINQRDSIDFIRWQLKITDLKEFRLSCTYGIGKPNTNGFIKEWKVECKGQVNFRDNILTFLSNGKSLSTLVLNQNILHILNEDGTMMTGNGGWSYTLNTRDPIQTSEINLRQKNIGFKDSVVFVGRTPCRGVEELLILRSRPECYKKKWLVRLYKDNSSASSGTYKLGSDGSRTGKWVLKKNNAGMIIYRLDLNNKNALDLLHVDENIVYILDGKAGIMVGDHDFSYSLNRRIK